MLSWAAGLLRCVAVEPLLPGCPEQDLGFLRLAAALSALSLSVYECTPLQLGATTHLHLPAATTSAAGAARVRSVRLGAKLLHLRQPAAAAAGATAPSPQQYALYEVEGLGLVVAFRGTDTLDDCLLNAQISPQPLKTGPQPWRHQQEEGEGRSTLCVHGGFLRGVLPHLPDIVAAARRARRASKGPQGLWVTGHSLGGAYAIVLQLLLLANPQYHDLLSSGGGVVTFGAPAVCHSADPVGLYQDLEALLSWAGSCSGHRFCFHNIINGMDLVPRLLGGPLAGLSVLLQHRLPSLANACANVCMTTGGYRPFGCYHLLHGRCLRTLGLPDHQQGQGQQRGAATLEVGAAAASEAQETAATAAAAVVEPAMLAAPLCPCHGLATSQASGQEVLKQLQVCGIWLASALSSVEAGLLLDHGMWAYKSLLCSTLEAAAARAAAAGAGSEAPGRTGTGGATGGAQVFAGNRSSPNLEGKARLFKRHST